MSVRDGTAAVTGCEWNTPPILHPIASASVRARKWSSGSMVKAVDEWSALVKA